jgi:uncharacterized repeat protein (TIGR03803 family)
MKYVSFIALAALALGAFTQAGAATSYKDLHDFCSQANCADGSKPYSGLTMDGAGYLYGTTTMGGNASSRGVIYKMSPVGRNWKQTTIHTFCGQTNCTDGGFPFGPPIADVNGNLFGTTIGGGLNNAGLIYELSPKGTRWSYRVLYNFCRLSMCADGNGPSAVSLSYHGALTGALYDGTSPLYGTTSDGGKTNDGVVFSFTPNGRQGSYQVIHNFCLQAGCPDGSHPVAGVILDDNGNLYGAADEGGNADQDGGVLYELAPNGTKWVETVLHTFCNVAGCPDGKTPYGIPVMDSMGNLYGTAQSGGAMNAGTVWRVMPNGRFSKFTLLHDFCTTVGCPDGGIPIASLTHDATGNLYGLTTMGGGGSAGALFRLSGANHTNFAVLESMGGATTPGTSCYAITVLDTSGALYGTCSTGGSTGMNSGVVFKLTP